MVQEVRHGRAGLGGRGVIPTRPYDRYGIGFFAYLDSGDLDDQPILDDGLLSSLDVVEFILYIEELREEEVDIEAIEPEVFNSIDTLVEAFFPDAQSMSEAVS